MYSDGDLHTGGVSPFGYPRINDRSHLPAAFRSVPRPSSPLGAKASTERPSLSPPTQSQARTQDQTAPHMHKTQEPGQRKHTHLPNQLTNHSIFTCQKNNPPGQPQGARQAAALEARNSAQPQGEPGEDLTTCRQANRRRHGGNRIRTGDPLLAKQVLYQLSYAPVAYQQETGQLDPPAAAVPRLAACAATSFVTLRGISPRKRREMGQGGLEPPTPRLSSVCSNQLSYWPQASAMPRPEQPSPSQGHNDR